MPRTYQRKPSARKYRDYSEETLLQAIKDCEKENIKDVAERHHIPFRTLWNKVKGRHSKPCGGQTALTKDVEEALVNCLLSCAEFGMPLEKRDVKQVVTMYLNRTGQNISAFSNNVPGDDWVISFLKRHEVLSHRMCQNIKRSRAEVAPEEVQQYFTNLRGSLEDVPPDNIVNYDETNLADDPGVKKFIFRRGTKYPERIMNHSKGNISVMFAGTATGELLPPFVVYKAEHLWEPWCQGGPKGTRYNRSKSGWMDGANFEEWFLTIIVPWARRREGPKVMIGDNLSSHLSQHVISKCEELNIRFVLLPPNSTDKCQPLDVSFFGPMKREWRKIMEQHKMRRPSSTSLDKAVFPSLLCKLIERMGIRIPENIVAGFRACGICPFNPDAVLKKFPNAVQETEAQRQRVHQVSPALLEYLQQFKYSPGATQKARTARRRLAVEPGKSVSAEELSSTTSSSSSSPRPNTPTDSSLAPSTKSKAPRASKSAPSVSKSANNLPPSTSAAAPPASTSSLMDPLPSTSDAVDPLPSTSAAPCASTSTRTHRASTHNLQPLFQDSVRYSDSDRDSDCDEDMMSSEDEWKPPATKRHKNIFEDFN